MSHNLFYVSIDELVCEELVLIKLSREHVLFKNAKLDAFSAKIDSHAV